jgi:hypothetical protein
VTKKPGNPRRGRRLHGVPKAGDLYVNGQKVPKGNVYAATSRVYRSTDTRRLDAGELAPITVVRVDAQLLHDDSVPNTCPSCDQPAYHGDHIALEQDTGQWWHMGVCRTRWVEQHRDAVE